MKGLAADRREGLRDFWRVYLEHSAKLDAATVAAVMELPAFVALAKTLPPGAVAAQNSHSRALMALAIEGNFEPYAENLRALGTTYARLDISFVDWHDITRAFARLLLPYIARTYAAEPLRLASALTAVYELMDFAVMVLADSYLATKEAVVADARTRHSAILDGALDCIVCMDEAGLVIEFNPAAERTFGYSREFAVGKALADLIIPPTLRTAHQRGLTHYLATGEGPIIGRRIELHAMHSDGTLFPAEVAISRIQSATGPVFTGFIRDLTAEKEAARALRQVEQQNQNLIDQAAVAAHRQKADATFRTLLESAPDAMVIVDDGGEMVLVNGQTEKLFGYRRSELLGERAEILVPDRFHVADGHFFSTPRSSQNELEIFGLRQDGSEFPIEISTRPLETDDGKLVSIAIRDITERKEAELVREELTHSLAMRAADLEVVNRELESFSYSVSHDLRGPLRALDGFSRALLKTADQKLDDTEKEYLQRIRGASQRMGRLIDDLLNLARISRAELDMEPVDLSHLCRLVVAELSDGKPERRVEVDIQPGLRGYGDPQLLAIALQNLIGNAWKFTEKTEGAHIHIGQENGAFFVRDNGAGFDMAYSSKLFNAFQRLHSQDAFSGTGIGLATVKRIVNRHGGTIWAEASVDRGATFYFTLHRSD